MPEPTDDAGTDDTGTDDTVLQELRALASDRSPLDVQWQAPPEGLWERIAAEAGAGSSESSAEVVELEPPARRQEPRREGPPGEGPPSSGRRSNGARRAPWFLAVAAALLLVGAVAWLFSDASGPDVVATAQLEPLGASGRGTAELVDANGTMQLRLDTEGLDPGDGFAEVWVIDRDVSKLVSLGPLRGDGIYDLPPGLDPGQYPVVDVSYEKFDGDPAHSGDSVLRGTLDV